MTPTQKITPTQEDVLLAFGDYPVQPGDLALQIARHAGRDVQAPQVWDAVNRTALQTVLDTLADTGQIAVTTSAEFYAVQQAAKSSRGSKTRLYASLEAQRRFNMAREEQRQAEARKWATEWAYQQLADRHPDEFAALVDQRMPHELDRLTD